MPTPCILFRFHKCFDVCAQNLRLLRLMNPGVSIHGMYGGAGGVSALDPSFAALFDHVFPLPFEDPNYNWLHGDLCTRWWYKQCGSRLDFTHLCIVEWDMIYLRPLHDVYANFVKEGNYLSCSNTYQNMVDKGWPWIQGRYQAPFDHLVKELRKEKDFDLEPLVFGIFGGCVLCRQFLDKYAARVIASYCNDEVRMTLYAQLFDIPINDTGFLTDKKNKVNAHNEEYTFDDFQQALANGADVIHPVRFVDNRIEELMKGKCNVQH